MEILAAIVEKGGLTEGAVALGKSQPSISRAIAQLEERLGVKLFESNKRPLQPTDFCAQLAQYGRTISSANREAGAFVTRFKNGQAGALRVAGSPIFMDGVVSPILAAFQAEYPSIEIVQSYGYATNVLDRLASGSLDLGVVPIRKSTAPKSVNVSTVLPGKNVIACRMGHPLTKEKDLSAEMISNQAWIAPPPESPLYQDLRAVLDGIGIEDIKVSFSGGSLSSILNFLNESDALTILPLSVVYRLKRQNSLAALQAPVGDPDRSLCVVTAQSNLEFPARERLIKYLRNELSSLNELISLHEGQ
ncbi:LysR family transcriptional regulator [Sulfitobacter aestuariivivens]|uniref:LysR family transcriptional regulator n=1 Tax=Sulfitobacter aestuariivivens TaxID=2766981 RepID=UPI0036242C22